MSITEILSISAAVLSSLGGGAAIIFGFSNWLGKIWASRLMEREKAKYVRELESLRNQFTQEIESYKNKLKKSEFIFERQFDAASEFVSLRLNIISVPFTHPEMDWGEVCATIAQDFNKIEKQLDLYISKHGAVLGEDITNLIFSAGAEAAMGKFEVSNDNENDRALDAADKLCDHLAEAEKKLIELVHSQSSN
ncbi:hypothetical protein FYZ48_07040 [Gimesia chilikensis]|uniref:hypothetical protein n=1 Tax=Gimesia chilikensis TaxID=2605989 RepID=UPI0011EDA73A|nr:hypothetical protein [Gimesia chilikensis]KAA0141021.1 hypothetical protein FYZ48_07040 [Gimesia chilikensis]